MMTTGDDTIPPEEIRQRYFRILRKEADCPQCGAVGDEPCLTWRGMTFLDGTRHKVRVGPDVVIEGEDDSGDDGDG